MTRTWKKALLVGAAVLMLATVVAARAKAAPGDLVNTRMTNIAMMGGMFGDGDALIEAEGASCSSCGGSDCGCDKLFGLIAPSDHCFDCFISPISNPLFFEDPRTLTEVRFIFVQHNLPGTAGGSLGGDAQYFALQIRAALTDRLSFIANKDGFIVLNTDALADEEGFADVAAGLKYNLWWDLEKQSIWSAGFTYEIDLGDHDVLQGKGDGEIHLFLSGARTIFCNSHWMTGTGFRLPTDRNARSSMWYWSNHIDHEIFPSVYGLLELNWFHWMGSGDGTSFGTTGFEGGDLFNLGSSGVSGNDIVTGAIGLRHKHSDALVMGVGFEFPLTDRRDILDNRIYADAIWRY